MLRYLAPRSWLPTLCQNTGQLENNRLFCIIFTVSLSGVNLVRAFIQMWGGRRFTWQILDCLYSATMCGDTLTQHRNIFRACYWITLLNNVWSVLRTLHLKWTMIYHSLCWYLKLFSYLHSTNNILWNSCFKSYNCKSIIDKFVVIIVKAINKGYDKL